MNRGGKRGAPKNYNDVDKFVAARRCTTYFLNIVKKILYDILLSFTSIEMFLDLHAAGGLSKKLKRNTSSAE